MKLLDRYEICNFRIIKNIKNKLYTPTVFLQKFK